MAQAALPTLCRCGDPSHLLNISLNIAFLLWVEQGAKIRAFGDLRQSRANLACVLDAPIKLVSWDRLVELSNLVNDHGREWGVFEADRDAAYKQIPPAPASPGWPLSR